MPVSILAPAYNEARVIAPAVRALLESQFGQLEVIVINDGSTDDTLAVLRDEFELVEVERVPSAAIRTMPVRAVYTSRFEPRLVVVDKDNGGKADSLNAGIKYSRYPLFCAIDADTILDPGALSRLVWEFQAYPETVGTGGIVRVILTALIMGLAVSYGLVLSFGAVLMEERAFRRYPDGRDLMRLLVVAVLENFGYRQLMVIVRARAWWTLLRRRSGWGEMTRAGFGGRPTPDNAYSSERPT